MRSSLFPPGGALRVPRGSPGRSWAAVTAAVGAVLLLLPATPPLAAGEASPADLLRKLRGIDSVYEAGFTTTGTEVLPPPLLAPEKPPVTMRWEFTAAGARRALILEGVGRPDPGQLQPDAEGKARVAAVPTRRVTVFDSTRSALLSREAVYELGPNGVREAGAIHVVSLCAPDALDLGLPPKLAMWVAGRGFSPFLHEITRVSELPGGLLAVTARGFESSPQQGRWDLTLDPAAAYLVREARFTPDGSPEPYYSMTNEGLQTSGACYFPRKAAWKVHVGDNQVTRFDFASAKLEVDEGLMERGRDFLKEPYPPNALIIDYRTVPSTIARTDNKGNLSAPKEIPHAPFGNAGATGLSARGRAYLMLGASLLLLSFSFLLVYYRARQRRGGP